ncbi:hypothetical protein AC249_AIPGENE21812 [Exaiptasia diaphana]|nr:hypothetical protein AC249_AIPGENE21812 [Exaiptasia diaphana]
MTGNCGRYLKFNAYCDVFICIIMSENQRVVNGKRSLSAEEKTRRRERERRRSLSEEQRRFERENDDEHKRWRDEWLGELKKTRETDKDFRKQINDDKVCTCEKHFYPEDIEIFHSEKMTKKKLRFGAIPTLNMPRKSHQSEPAPRRTRQPVRSDHLPVIPEMVEPLMLPQLEIIVDESLGFTVKVYGSFLVEDHPVYLKYRRSLQNLTFSNLVKELESLRLCNGVEAMELTGKLFHHVVPIHHDSLSDDEEQEQFPHKGFWRVKGCLLIGEGEEKSCSVCTMYADNVNSAKKSQECKPLKPAHLNAPVSKTDPERIKLALQGHRLKVDNEEPDQLPASRHKRKRIVEPSKSRKQLWSTPGSMSGVLSSPTAITAISPIMEQTSGSINIDVTGR